MRAVSGEALYRDPARTLVRVEKGDLLFITISPTTPLRKLKDKYCASNAVEKASLVFEFAGCTLEEEDTPERLNMRDGDTITVRMREDFLTAGKGDSCSLQHEYLALLEDESLADVDLVLGPNRIIIKVHRAVLAARNPHFRTLLASPGAEHQKTRIEMPDTDPRLMKHLLQFIYARKVIIPEDTADALGLLSLADQYHCGGLKERLETAVIGRTTPATVVALLCAADGLAAPRLQRHCRQHLLKHWAEAPGQEQLMGHPTVMVDLIEAAVDLRQELNRAPSGISAEEVRRAAKRRKSEPRDAGRRISRSEPAVPAR